MVKSSYIPVDLLDLFRIILQRYSVASPPTKLVNFEAVLRISMRWGFWLLDYYSMTYHIKSSP